ncbi:reverse transcriptase-like protein, partial [Robertmurraya kyonggiensis]
PLPRIDQVVDSTAGCEALCFLDAYSGYHQIALKESDQLATSFVTPCGVFCYTAMAFGLKNAGATFQRCMNQCLGDLVGQTVEVYVDDIVVKSKLADDLVQDLEATFDRLRANCVKLNLEKCVFGVSKGLLLGFVVSARGIEANPQKIVAITNMGPLSSVKDVQKLAGCLAALGRFVSRLGERGLPLYKLLKRDGRFEWNVEAQQALDQLKHMLTKPPILVPPREGEHLLLYVAATTQVVSAVLVVEREEEGHALKIQHPVYYISEVLTESKTRYLHIQKMIYAILIAKRKLRHYFDAHRVTVVTEHALGEVINNREATGRITKWSLELMGYDISYAPRSAIKSQILADFVAEWTETQLPQAPADLEYWVLHFDGAQNRTGSGVGVVFISPMGVMMRYAIRLHFPALNNMAEYEALLARLRIAKELGIHRLEARGDSQLVVDQVNGDAKCYNPKLAVYCEAARRAQEKFKGLGFVHLRREYNKAADELAKLASWRQPVPPGVFADDQHQPSVNFNDEAPSLGPNPDSCSAPREVPTKRG